ncbi:MAG: ABC transporter substrate-binding protein [Desulfocapsa sp.]|nr:ABC transporter substrate-binding protein [Desulfocapsa sp.]
MVIKRLLLLLLGVFLLAGQPAIASPGPTEVLRPTLEGMIEIIKDPAFAGSENKDPRREKVMSIAAQGFDFTEMSKRALGKTWRKLDISQKQHFEELFTKLLENAYIGKLEGYSGQEIIFKGERIKGKKAAVATIVKNSGTVPFSVSYVMLHNDIGWQVYDLNIEGVSFLRNYREQFKSILRKEKFPGLVKVLEEKNASFNIKGIK